MTIIFLCFLVFTTMKIFKWKIDSNHTKEVIIQIKKEINIPTKEKDIMDISPLIKKNKDTFGYIKINGTQISYPFVKTKDNKFYLNHSFDKKYNDAGWIFMDYRNKDLNDKNVILYAHDRKDNTMFGTLKYTLKKSWQEDTNNHVITIYTNKTDKILTLSTCYTEKEKVVLHAKLLKQF